MKRGSLVYRAVAMMNTDEETIYEAPPRRQSDSQTRDPLSPFPISGLTENTVTTL